MSSTSLLEQQSRASVHTPPNSSEFTVTDQRVFNRSSPVRWIVSHVWHFRALLITFIVGSVATSVFNGMIPGLTGAAVDEVVTGGDRLDQLVRIALLMLLVVIVRGLFDIVARYTDEVMA